MTESSIEVPESGRSRTGKERLLGLYYAIKYRAFARERRPHDGRRGLVALQIDALAYADLRRAIEQGYMPTLDALVQREGYVLRRWFCGLPSSTPYCQAGFFHGENGGIPAFRFYDKIARRVITCNAPHGVQYIRDRIHSPGALAGGSSYVNLLDGDAQTVAFTVATRERLSLYQRLGGTRMLLLVALHPVRVARMALQSLREWIRHEWERLSGEMAGRATHSEGFFFLLRIFTNVVIRELQTLAVMLDIYLGVPIIYTTYMQYDELGHHFGPASRQALSDLRRTDARIREIRRMIQSVRSREYDLVILSDHGMTPAASYRVRFGQSLGSTIRRILDEIQAGGTPVPVHSLASFAEDSEYADMAARLLDSVSQAARPQHRRFRATAARISNWLRSKYGLRELLLPEKYHVSRQHDVVVTYSSSLAHLYFADDERQLSLPQILKERRRGLLYAALLAHPGIGLVLTRTGPSGASSADRAGAGAAVHIEAREGRAELSDSRLRVVAGQNPLELFGSESHMLRAIEELVLQPNAGDMVLFGAYDGYENISFDDQVGAHGAAGGEQTYPFIVAPPHLYLDRCRIENARDIHRHVLSRYAAPDGASWTDQARESQPVSAGQA